MFACRTLIINLYVPIMLFSPRNVNLFHTHTDTYQNQSLEYHNLDSLLLEISLIEHCQSVQQCTFYLFEN